MAARAYPTKSPTSVYSFTENGKDFEGMIIEMPGIGKRFYVFAAHDFQAYTMPLAEAYDRQLTISRPTTASDTTTAQQTIPEAQPAA